MTWKLVDDGQTPREVYNWGVYASGGIIFGFTNSFFGSVLALPSFNAQFNIVGLSIQAQNDLASNLAVCYQAGCLGACFIAYPFAEIMGRRKAMGLFGLIFLLGSCLMLIKSLPAFYAGRFLTGFGLGPITAIGPLYLAEISPPALRGRFIGFMDIFYQVGAIIGFWTPYGTSIHMGNRKAIQWRIPVALQIPLVMIFIVGLLFVPETPRFLCKREKLPQAKTIMSRLRKLPEDHAYVQREMDLIETELLAEREMMGLSADAGPWTAFRKQLVECTRPGIRYRISIGVITMMIGQFSGVNGLNYYSPRIFASLGVKGNNVLLATSFFGIINFITAFISGVYLVDRLGRRTLLLGAGVIMTISMFYIGAYLKVAGVDSSEGLTPAGVVALVFIYIYLVGFVGGYANVTYVLSAECAPLNVRAMAATLGAAAQWLGNLAVVKATPYMITSLKYGTFFFFGACTVLGSIYIWYYVPETRGLPMEELDIIFGMNLVHQDVEEGAARKEATTPAAKEKDQDELEVSPAALPSGGR